MMNTSSVMKYIGIAVMLVAHPLGYRLFSGILRGPFAYCTEYWEAEFAILVGVGILEIFFIGLTVFVIGTLLGRKKD